MDIAKEWLADPERVDPEMVKKARDLYRQWLADTDNLRRLEQLRDERDAREAYQQLAWT